MFPPKKKLVRDIDAILDEGNFKMKEWIFTRDRTDLLKTITNDKSSKYYGKGIGSCMEPSSRRICI